MKTTLLKSTLLAASLMGAFSTASAETLHAKIPFGFSANGTVMPAGAYTIRSTDVPSVLLFENEETNIRAMVFARVATDAPFTRSSPMTFTAGADNRMALTSIETTTGTYELSIGAGRSPVKGAVLALTPSK